MYFFGEIHEIFDLDSIADFFKLPQYRREIFHDIGSSELPKLFDLLNHIPIPRFLSSLLGSRVARWALPSPISHIWAKFWTFWRRYLLKKMQ